MLELFTETLIQTLPPMNNQTKGVNYHQLEQLLQAGKWKEADQETAQKMFEVAGRKEEGVLRKKDIDNFPCEDLRTIDQLWVKYSNGRFGFSVQKKIGLEVTCGPEVGDIDEYEIEFNLGDRVGWRKNNSWMDGWMNYDDLTFSILAPLGHLPVRCVWVLQFWSLGARSWSLVLGAVSSLASRLVDCNI
ncbi:MAG TPA: hypothetical protein DEF27_12625 [Oscillatoriales bacterium UBA8482]|nr:hypothetical protein [Oscillatoriales bacterium UBA8482]